MSYIIKAKDRFLLQKSADDERAYFIEDYSEYNAWKDLYRTSDETFFGLFLLYQKRIAEYHYDRTKYENDDHSHRHDELQIRTN